MYKPLDERGLARSAFLTGWRAIAADLALITFATALVCGVAYSSERGFDGSVKLELFFCAAGALGLLNVVASGDPFVGLYVAGEYKWALLHFAVVLGAVLASDVALRYNMGGEPWRALSNWAVMLASGSTANLMAPWPVSHQSLAAIDKRLWVLLWLIYEVAEAYLSLFGATTSWKLVVATLGLRRLVFLAVNTLFAFVTYGGPRRMFKQFGKFASPLILVPNSTVGGWAFPDGEKGVYKLAPMEQVDLEELAAVGGGMLLKLSMHGGYAPCPPDPNAILFLEQMISFGSPTSVIGSRAAIGHVLYIAEMVDAVAAANLTKTAFEEVRDDMARPGDERGDCVNRYTTRDANRLVLREWLLGSRWNAVDAMDTPHTNAALRLCDDDKFVAGPDQRRAPPILVQMNEFDFDEDGIATAKKRAINNCARADAKLAYTPGP